MAFDGFVTKAIVKELQNSIINSKVNKVLEPTKNDIILSLYKNGINYALLLNISSDFCRINLTKYSKQNPQTAYNFCMLLRKYLINSKIISVTSIDLERTIEIDFECYNELNDLVIRKLYIEIMSRQSNVIFTNENNIIIDTIKHVNTDLRKLLPANPYEEVTSSKESFIKINSFEYFFDIINSKKMSNNLLNILTSSFIGFSKSLIQNVLIELNIPLNDFDKNDLEKLYNYLKRLLDCIDSNDVYCKKISEKDYVISINQEAKEDESPINDFIDDFYHNKEDDIEFVNTRNNLLKIVSSYLKKVYKKVENINSKLKECEKKDTYKLYGELLTANLYKLNSEDNFEFIELENYYDNNNLIKIPLNKSLSIKENIEKYFKKYNKLKNASQIVSLQKKQAELEIDYIESIVFSIENAKSMKDINEVYEEISENILGKKVIQSKKKQKVVKHNVSKMPDIDCIEFQDYKIYIGKNNLQNDYLTFKFANKNDVWFHTQDVHGSHIILRVSEKPELNTSNVANSILEMLPIEVIEFCAKLAKDNSKAKDATGAMIDYCLVKNIKKQPNSKPGMVNFVNYKSIYIK